MFITLLLIIAGFIFLITGANWMVDGASSLAKKHNISDLAIGLTIVAFGTSAPELVVNCVASFQGYADIIFGNVIGSNNFNLFIILGLVGLLYPITVRSTTVWREIPISLFVTLLLFFLVNGISQQNTFILSRTDAFILIGCFILFLFYVFRQMKREEPQSVPQLPKSNLYIWTRILFGLAGLIAGGQLVIHYSVELAQDMGLSEKIIGLTIIAAGTSLPELVTSLVAAVKKNSDIAIGNIIGSNIFNILLVLAISAFIRPIHYNPIFNDDIAILAGGTIFLFIAMFTGRKKELDRWESALMLFFYLTYTIWLVWQEL